MIGNKEEYYKDECEGCGDAKQVRNVPDPYIEEMHNGVKVYRFLCDECYLEYAGDV